MRIRNNFFPLALLATALLVGMTAFAQAGLVDLGVVSQTSYLSNALTGTSFDAVGVINNSGDVVGNVKDLSTSTVHGYYYNHVTATSLTPNGTSPMVYGIADNGTIVGSTNANTGAIWYNGPTNAPTSTHTGLTVAANYGMASTGWTIGMKTATYVTSTLQTLTLWTGGAGGSLTSLGAPLTGYPTGSNYAYARSINANGQSGIYLTYSGYKNAYLDTITYVPPPMDGYGQSTVNLGGLSGYFVTGPKTYWTGGNTEVFDINANGALVGASTASSGTYHAIYATVAGTTPSLTDLGVLGLGASEASFAYGINSQNQVVGCDSWTGGSTGFLATVSGGAVTSLIDLNSLLPAGSDWTVVAGWDINDNGQILAAATLANDPLGTGVYHQVLLTVPEPSTLLLVVVGLAGLLAWRKRK